MQHKFTASFGAPVRLEWIAQAEGEPLWLREPLDLPAGVFAFQVTVDEEGLGIVSWEAVIQ